MAQKHLLGPHKAPLHNEGQDAASAPPVATAVTQKHRGAETLRSCAEASLWWRKGIAAVQKQRGGGEASGVEASRRWRSSIVVAEEHLVTAVAQKHRGGGKTSWWRRSIAAVAQKHCDGAKESRWRKKHRVRGTIMERRMVQLVVSHHQLLRQYAFPCAAS